MAAGGELKRGQEDQAQAQPATHEAEGAMLDPEALNRISLSLSFLICKTRARPPFSGFIRDHI